MRREQEAAAAERRRRAAAREASSSDAKLEQAAKDQAQAAKDRQMREAAERARRQPMFKHGGAVKKYAKGGSVSSASKRADGCATKGKTRGKFV
jgi:membrane protein involved in colicin uptake